MREFPHNPIKQRIRIPAIRICERCGNSDFMGQTAVYKTFSTTWRASLYYSVHIFSQLWSVFLLLVPRIPDFRHELSHFVHRVHVEALVADCYGGEFKFSDR